MTDNADGDSQLNAIVHAYLRARDSGELPSQAKLLSENPELADELQAFFRELESDHLAEDAKPTNADLLAETQVLDGDRAPSEVDTASPASVFDSQADTILPGESSDSSPALSPASQVQRLGDYELLEQIGQGGMGVVYRARQVSLDRIVALKTIRSGRLASNREVERFQIEAEAAAELDHPSIVPVFEVGQSDGTHYFSMGYVEGQSLAGKLRDGPMLPAEAARLLAKLATAVAYAHGRGVIHRDLKPDNVLLTSQDLPRITDFGLAKRTDADSEQTQTGEILGTPAYMPPEQASGSRTVGPTSDVYGLGAILYATLTVRPPFQAASQMDTLRQVLENDPVSPRQMDSGIPRDLETICLKCLQKDQQKRYPSASELANDLQRFVDGQPIHARPVGLPERGWMWCKRNPKIALPSVAAALLALVLMIGGPILAANFYQQKQLAVVNEKLAIANADAAVTTSRTVLDKTYKVFRKQPKEKRQLMAELLQVALDGAQEIGAKHEAFVADAGARIGMRADLSVSSAHKKFGEISLSIGQPTKALQQFEESLEIAKALDAEDRLPDRHLNFANLFERLGNTHLLLGQLDDAERNVGSALDHWEQLREQDPSQALGILQRMAKCYGQLGTIAGERGNSKLAREYAKKVLKVRRDWLAMAPDDLRGQRELAGSLWGMGRTESDMSLAAEYFGLAIEILENLVKQQPNEPSHALNLPRFGAALGDVELQNGEPAKARTSYESAIERLQELLESDQQNDKTKRHLAHAYYANGIACEQLGDSTQAHENYRRCLLLRQEQFDRDETKTTRVTLMFALARCQEHERAAALANQVQQNSPNSGDLANIAACFALCSTASDLTASVKQAYVTAAIENLQKAVDAGYANADTLLMNPDLTPIRDHAKFVELVTAIRNQ